MRAQFSNIIHILIQIGVDWTFCTNGMMHTASLTISLSCLSCHNINIVFILSEVARRGRSEKVTTPLILERNGILR